jgi:hypothetical protein
MKNLFIVFLLLVGVSAATAQEVYTSSGKPGYHKKSAKKHKKGYDPDRLIVGGGFAAGYSSGYASFGLAPIVGYRITDHFMAGVGFGYKYAQQPVYVDPVDPNKASYIRQNLLYPNIWTRYIVFRNFFVSGTVEYDFISQRGPGYDNYGNLTTVKMNVTNTALLLGAGLRQPLGGRVSLFAELIYDVLQGENSPYPKGTPDVNFGFAAGL